MHCGGERDELGDGCWIGLEDECLLRIDRVL